MKLPAFEYVLPAVLEEALGIMAEHDDQAKPLGRWSSWSPPLAMRRVRPSRCRVDLHRVAETPSGYRWRPGACASGPWHGSATLRRLPVPGLVRAAILQHIGHFQI